MARKVDQALWEQWRQRVERQLRSRLSIAEFCRSEGVSQASFHAWKRKLRISRPGSPSSRRSAPLSRSKSGGQGDGQQSQPARRSLTNSAATARAANFLEVPILGARTAPWIELLLVDGTIIRVPQQNLAALQTVLQMLRGGHVAGLMGEVSHA
jgi:transposase-like protein